MAVALLALAVTSAGVLAASSSRANTEAGRRTQATALATQEFEALRQYRDTRARQGQPWVSSVPPIAAGSNCVQFVMNKQTSNQWEWVTTTSPVPYPPGPYESFSRIVTTCKSHDYAYNSSTGIGSQVLGSDEVRTVTVEVFWQESNGPTRKTAFQGVLANWARD